MIEEYNINSVGYKIQSQDIKHVRVQKVLPEGAISGSISDKVFLSDEGREDPNSATSGPAS